MLSNILGFLASPVTAWVEGKASREYMKAEGALAITKAKVALEIATSTAKATRLMNMDSADADYDSQAQVERRYTIADEVLILCVIVLVGAHFFVPASLAAGWAAMGYASAPWWLEFIIVGIFVSVFGLMRLFRAWSPFGSRNVTGETK
jgi:hypothetical protein